MATITIKDLGQWALYTPDEIPPDAPANTLFARRLSDGVDWYSLAHDPAAFDAGTLLATALPTTAGLIVQVVVRDPTRCFPASCRLIEIVGHNPADPDPEAAYKDKVVDLAAGAFTDAPVPDTLIVSKAQGKIALLNAGLLDRVEQMVAGLGDPALKIWWNDGGQWDKASAYVQSFAQQLGLSPDQLTALFNAAGKIKT